MSGDAMPREQQAFIDKVYQFVSDATNMTKDEAKDFSFRVWQMQGFLRTALTPWISVKDRLPDKNIDSLLFVVHTPTWDDVTEELAPEYRHFPEETTVVAGWFDKVTGKRYWSWYSEGFQNTIEGEISKEYTGQVTFITHWMPLPEPPGVEVEG